MADNKSSYNPIEEYLNRLKPNTMSGRTMKYPYTLSAKVALFPYGYYFKNVWLCRYYVAGVAVCLPIFHWIQKLSCSPENVAKVEAKKKQEAAAHH